MNPKQKRNSKDQLRREYGSCCCWCGCDLNSLPLKEQTLEHLIPKSKGGSNSRKNLMLSCHKCNKSRDNSLFPPQNRNPTLFSTMFAAIVTACQSDQGVDIEKLRILLFLLKGLFRCIPLNTRINSEGKLQQSAYSS